MKLPIQLSRDSREPIYHQIETQMKALIASGTLAAGTPLPSIRVLAKDLEVSAITTRRVYQNLEQEGFTVTRQGKGTFVADIDKEVKMEVKTEAIFEAFKRAIQIARGYNYTDEQIKLLFEDTLNEEEKDDE